MLMVAVRYVPIAQRIECHPAKVEVIGSNPIRDAMKFYYNVDELWPVYRFTSREDSVYDPVLVEFPDVIDLIDRYKKSLEEFVGLLEEVSKIVEHKVTH